MSRNRVFLFSSTLLLILACSFITTSAGTSGGTLVSQKTAAGAQATATSGSEDFYAKATSPQSIMLAWKAMAGATGYILEFGWNGKDFYPLVNLPPSQTQYEDFTALPGSTESYRLRAVTSSGSGDWLRADATTPAASANPVPVTPAFDIQKAATASIGPEGGTVALTDGGGVKYKLDIPAGALSQATEVQLVPLTGLDGWPLDGDRLATVRIDPAGVQLKVVGTLTITVHSPVRADLATVGFGFQPTGDDFHLERIAANPAGVAGLLSPGGRLAAPARQDANVLTLQVVKLAVLGAGQGSADAITNLGRNNAPADAEGAVGQQQAVMDSEGFELSRLEPVHDTGAKDAARRLEGELGKIEDQIRTASDGDALGAAMTQFDKWQAGTKPLTADEYRQMTELFWEMMTDKLKELLDKAAKDCQDKNGPPPQGAGSISAYPRECHESALAQQPMGRPAGQDDKRIRGRCADQGLGRFEKRGLRPL